MKATGGEKKNADTFTVEVKHIRRHHPQKTWRLEKVDHHHLERESISFNFVTCKTVTTKSFTS